MPPGATACDKHMDGLRIFLFHGDSKLGCPAALSADHGELIPGQMDALAVDVDQDAHRDHRSDKTGPSVTYERQRQPLVRQQSSGHAHVQAASVVVFDLPPASFPVAARPAEMGVVRWLSTIDSRPEWRLGNNSQQLFGVL